MIKHIFLIACSSLLFTQTVYADSTPLPRFVGRFDETRPHEYRLGWAGSRIEYRFKGTKLSAVIEDNGKNSILIDIDGNKHRINLANGKKKYDLVSFNKAGEHNLSITKITEGSLGTVTLSQVRADGSFLAVPDRARKMMVIGDSISNGYGIEGKDVSCTFSPETENQSLTYAARTAQQLDADLLVIAESGRGLIQNLEGNGLTMQNLLNRIIPSEPKEIPQDHFQPDVLLIHLGTNDYGGASLPVTNFFEKAYLKLLKDMASRYPQAHIYALLGPMLSDQNYAPAQAAVQKAVSDFNSSTQSIPAKFIAFRGDDYNHFGCNWHPNALSHQKMAETLEKIISLDMNWNEPPPL